MATHLIGEKLTKIDKYHGGSLNHWVGGFMHITSQTLYDLQYLTMCLSGYNNAPVEPALLARTHGMEYIIHHPQKPIIYSWKKIHKTHESPHQCYFKEGNAEINKNQEYSNFPHTYWYADHSRNLADRHSDTSTFHIFDGNLIEWCSKKKSETSRSSSNAKTRAIHTGVFYQNFIRNSLDQLVTP